MGKELLIACAEDLLHTIEPALLAFEKIGEEAWTHKPDPSRWSKKEILGHLVDSAANNHLRFVRAQLADTEFISFAYEQNFFVSSQHYNESSTQELITLWSSYNKHLAQVIRNVDPSKLSVPCRIGNYDPAPLSFIITDYVTHLKHHLVQITA